ncbi:MAG TPA: class II aldolase/adducin family protein [Candidatus Syntrophosphaera sp.]|nr:class II aldolase/adducin family protein [Candidatus Syntrophosphaera sp.]
MLERVQLVAEQINLSGWAEANAGNLSIDVTQLLPPVMQTGTVWYLVTRSGSRYRDLARAPQDELVLVSIRDHEEKCWPEGARPTSEWNSHLQLQQRFRAADRPERVILHAHPASLILLSQTDVAATPESLHASLSQALPEFDLYLPQGIAIANAAPPGSLDLAQASLQALDRQQALLWPGHGLLTFAPDPDSALDLMQVADKATRLLLDKYLLTHSWS